jgi:hypothetical protein
MEGSLVMRCKNVLARLTVVAAMRRTIRALSANACPSRRFAKLKSRRSEYAQV